LAASETPDLILVDFGLPDIDGPTVVPLLREMPHLARTPIVAITAWPEAAAQEMATQYGCDGCISKPISVRDFPEQIAAFLDP
jgi:two-component system cell cycle response regulator DivK